MPKELENRGRSAGGELAAYETTATDPNVQRRQCEMRDRQLHPTLIE